jgi:L-alanine-DL-glutamate epimerase-like enolase superfamily enzyme
MIRIRNVDTASIHLYLRMPFRFGIHTLTEVPHLFVQVEAEIDGETARGTAAEHLLPKWFTKVPEKPIEEEIAEIHEVVDQAIAFAREIGAENVFRFWRELYDRQAAWGEQRGWQPLLVQLGVTIIERALIDAAARRHGATVHELIRDGRLGIDLGELADELADAAPADLLPPAPLDSIIARHTVGLTDPLTAADVTEENRIDDGLPQSLEQCIRFYGLRHFKLKVGGDIDQDIPRLQAIAEVITANAPADFAFSLDGNEQFYEPGDFHAFWERIAGDPALKRFFDHVLFIEQPLNRKVALSDEVAAMRQWQGLPPIIIDESDAEIDSMQRALELGYAGTSHKNCKGVIRGIMNRCLINHRKRQDPGWPGFMSGEDLVNIGPVALLQDLTIQATLGNETVERNGHHYFKGLSAFPDTVQARVLDQHGDLYRRTEQGWPALDVRDGRLDLRSINRAPFGVGFELPMDAFAKHE